MKKYWKKILAWAAIVLLAFCAIKLERDLRNLRANNGMLKHNIEALRDTVKTQKMKNGELLATISGYASEISDLKMYSEDLKKQVDNYKKATGNSVASMVSGETATVLPEKEIIFYTDTVYQTVVTYGSFLEKFDFSDEWRSLTGTFSVDKTATSVQLDPETIFAKFSCGVDEKNNVFITTDNPYVKITGLEGFTLPKPKQKKWGVGVHAGYGYNFGAGSFGPEISVGINYNLIMF